MSGAGSINVLLFRTRRKFLNLFRFGTKTWSPHGFLPSHLSYYPDGLSKLPNVADLYRRWIRGNKVNNNGDVPRFLGLMLNVQKLVAEGIEGDFAELGVWRGNSAAILAHFAAQSGKRLFLFDTFSGFDPRDFVGHDADVKPKFSDTSMQYAAETIGHPELTTFVPGFFPESVTDEVASGTFALAHIDCDLYEPMKAALDFFYPRLSKGGMLIIHDYGSVSWTGAGPAVDDFLREHGEFLVLWPDKSGTAMLRKTSS